MFADEIQSVLAELRHMSDKVQNVIDEEDQVANLANSMKDAESVLFLGRHVGFPVALEGALKLKEIAYLHAEGFAAGELKHGPIALIEEGQPVFVIVPSTSSSTKRSWKSAQPVPEEHSSIRRTPFAMNRSVLPEPEGYLRMADVASRVDRLPARGRCGPRRNLPWRRPLGLLVSFRGLRPSDP